MALVLWRRDQHANAPSALQNRDDSHENRDHPIYDQLIQLSGAPAFGVQAGALDGVAAGTSSAARFDNRIGSARIDNSVKYTSPTVSGFKASGGMQQWPCEPGLPGQQVHGGCRMRRYSRREQGHCSGWWL